MLLQAARPPAVAASVRDRIIGFLLTMCVGWIEKKEETAALLVLLNWPPDHLGIGRESRQFLPAQASCREFLAQARAVPPSVAARTRIVSVAGIRLDPLEICATFQRDILRRHF
jgi:hypothetical protein